MRRIAGRVALALGSLLFFALLVEAGVRVVLAFRVDPSLLWHGTGFDGDRAPARWNTLEGRPRWDRTIHVDERRIKVFVDGPFGSYSRYQPHSARGMKLADGSVYKIVHNRFGFRGPDFAREPAPGVIRVVSLGASSTFGYLARDDETYPHYLEEQLDAKLAREGCGEVTDFEVLNLGIPHLDSANLYALFMSEGLSFEPDVVTFYEGANEARHMRRSGVQRAILEASEVSAAFLFLSHLLETRFESFSAEDLAVDLDGLADRYLENLGRIAAECEARGIVFVVASQQAKSHAVPPERLNEVGYDAEVAQVRAELAAGRRLDLARLQFLMHAELMERLRAWVERNDVRFVDFIHVLEAAGHRDGLLSWVHLAPEANRVLAAALADEIFAATCGGSRS